ncbi:MAG: Ig-like domain-containing protein, partial [Methanoregulaceae archaeon]|nr:Ig-like domain-containing protein [Methanoregulaceae archaeon]
MKRVSWLRDIDQLWVLLLTLFCISFLLVTVAGAANTTITGISSTINPSFPGQSVTFHAVVSVLPPGAGYPTGTISFLDGVTPLGTVSLNTSTTARGQRFTTNSLTPGIHSITAVYNGNANYLPSTSPELDQEVSQAATATLISSTVNPSFPGQSVTFHAVVRAVPPRTGNPTGTISFMDGETLLGTVTLNTSTSSRGQRFTTTTLPPGIHSITAVYNGNANYLPGTSTELDQEVSRAATATLINSTVNPAVPGQPVTFHAVVRVVPPRTGYPTGTVTFMDGETPLATTALNTSTTSRGQQLLISSLAPGIHSIAAVYNGDANYLADTSPELSQEISQASTATEINSTVNPSVFGQTVTFHAVVRVVPPHRGIWPTGTITFMEGDIPLGTVPLNTSTVARGARLAISNRTAGNHPITAVYNPGNSNYAASTSPELLQTVNPASTTTLAGTSANPSAPGQPVTVHAIVRTNSPGVGYPSGVVTFMDGGEVLGSGMLNTSTSARGTSFTTSALAAGSHTITAVYEGNANFLAGTSQEIIQEVSQAPTTTAIGSTANPSVFGQTVTFHAVVRVIPPFSGALPTGTVTFVDGLNPIGTVLLNTSTTKRGASLSISNRTVGSHTITAVYNPNNTNYVTSTSPELLQTVNPASTLTLFGSPVNPSLTRQPVTFHAIVRTVSPGTGYPSGIVTFMDGTSVLGSNSLNTSTSRRGTSFTTPALDAGFHEISAIYEGNGNYSASTSSAIMQVVNKRPSTTSLVSLVNPSTYGGTVTFNATVSGSAGTPTGTIVFLVDSTPLGSPVTLNAGSASIQGVPLPAGTHTITAVFSGDDTYLSSDGPLDQVVLPASTSTTVTSSVDPSRYGQPVTYTATISSGGGIPGGTVLFSADGYPHGDAVPVDGSGSATSTTLSFPGAGVPHTISAAYSGSLNFTPSTGICSQKVDQASTIASLATNKTPVASGETVRLDVIVTV